ncbi:noggin-2-like [Ptychodera flava]|uniref:noggin-2-like n=1 Tax=Ptychodera flava TaxID=63121 RepID=UPI003969BC19
MMTRRNLCVLTAFSVCWICVSRVMSTTTQEQTLNSLRSRDPPLKVSNYTYGVLSLSWVGSFDTSQAPKARDLRAKKLKKKLGKDFDPDRMSIDEPSDKSETETTVVSDTLKQQVSELDFSYVDDDGNPVTMDEQTVEHMQNWLAHKAACPVQDHWVHVGQLFWPRWVKVGQCNEQMCSWPEGMACQPGKYTDIHLLLWYCPPPSRSGDSVRPAIKPNPREKRDAGGGGGGGEKKKKKGNKKDKKKCKWIKVPYPLITECTCQCKDKK